MICRDEISCQRAKKYLSKKREENVVCYHDFSYDVYHRVFPSNLKRQYVSSNKIILLNAPYTKTLEKCVVNHLSDATYLLFFPCEYVEDKEYFVSLQQYFPQVEIYDWTKYLLIETLKTFAGACFGVGERLHFCLPLQYYQVPYICVEKKDKQKKLLFN